MTYEIEEFLVVADNAMEQGDLMKTTNQYAKIALLIMQDYE